MTIGIGSGPMTSGRAYRIFYNEIGRHLADLRELFAPEYSMTPDDMLRCAGALHTIKGGAGFFGLTEIASIAGELETLFNSVELSGEDLPAELRERARDQFTTLESHARDLPTPEPSPT